MQIEVGKSYRTRDGQRAFLDGKSANVSFGGTRYDGYVGKEPVCWWDDGICPGYPSLDLISEWTDEPAVEGDAKPLPDVNPYLTKRREREAAQRAHNEQISAIMDQIAAPDAEQAKRPRTYRECPADIKERAEMLVASFSGDDTLLVGAIASALVNERFDALDAQEQEGK